MTAAPKIKVVNNFSKENRCFIIASESSAVFDAWNNKFLPL